MPPLTLRSQFSNKRRSGKPRAPAAPPRGFRGTPAVPPAAGPGRPAGRRAFRPAGRKGWLGFPEPPRATRFEVNNKPSVSKFLAACKHGFIRCGPDLKNISRFNRGPKCFMIAPEQSIGAWQPHAMRPPAPNLRQEPPVRGAAPFHAGPGPGRRRTVQVWPANRRRIAGAVRVTARPSPAPTPSPRFAAGTIQCRAGPGRAGRT
jgi:hypothetical protein